MSKIYDFSSARNLNLFNEVMDKNKKESTIRKISNSISTYTAFHSKEELLLKQSFSKLMNEYGKILLNESELFLTSGNYNSYRLLSTYFKNKIVLVPEHIHISHKKCFRAMGKEVIEISEKDGLFDLNRLRDAISSYKSEIAFIYVNHPTAPLLEEKYINELAEIVSINEQFLVWDFDSIFTNHNGDLLLPIKNTTFGERIIGLFTLSKEFGVPGIRIGFGHVRGSLAKKLQDYKNDLLDIIPHFEHELALHLLKEYPINKAIIILKERMKSLMNILNNSGFKIKTPASGINIFVEAEDNSEVIKNKLAKEGVLVRSGSEYGFDNSVRFVISVPIATLQKVKIEYPFGKLITEADKEVSRLIKEYKKYLVLREKVDNLSLDKAKVISDNIRFTSPLVWMMFKNKQKILFNSKKEEMTVQEFLNHCDEEKETCGKRLKFLEVTFKKKYGLSFINPTFNNSTLKQLFISSQFLRLCNENYFLSEWCKYEFYEENGKLAKWKNYTSL